jgi:hypothetical protein
MVFGAEELRVLRRALAVALHERPARAEDVQDCLRLAESLDEAMREGARLRAFLVADLARYRAALPGTTVGYCALLAEALDGGYRPGSDDLAALRALRGNPAAAALLRRCGAEEPPQAPGTAPAADPLAADPVAVVPATEPVAPAVAAGATAPPAAAPTVPASRSPLRCVAPLQEGLRGLPGLRGGLPGARGAQDADDAKEPAKKPASKPAERPAPAEPRPAPAPAAPKPARRPVPTPGEVFPRRRPTPPAGSPQPQQQRLAV